METHVFANDCEICSKASDGKSMAAFPDVCWSPPAGPVQVPYQNTAYAKDLANGSKTVFICNTEIALKDRSFFATSTGNEAATDAFDKGINTGAIQGKAYFVSWSMNVLAEGLNVARHEDRMTHNHASPGGNTSAAAYLATQRMPEECGAEQTQIDRKCKPEEDGDENTKKVRQARKNFLKKISERFKATTDKMKQGAGYKRHLGTQWMDHCDGLWIPPGLKDYGTEVQDMLNQLDDIRNDMAGVVAGVVRPLVEKVGKELLEKLAKEAAERGVKLAARAGARWAVGASGAAVAGVGAVVTETIATAWNIYDWGTTAWEGYKLGKEIYGALSEIEGIMFDFDKSLGQLDQIYQNAAKDPEKAAADLMGILARLNACTRARRCMLREFSKTKTAAAIKQGKGCCPGQTGHHVLPKAMTTQAACPGVTEGGAPTLCVEGLDDTHGTQGQVHGNLTKLLADNRTKTLSYKQARDLAVQSIQRTFPESNCSKKCLRAQLDAYYADKCKNPMSAAAGMTPQNQGGSPGAKI